MSKFIIKNRIQLFLKRGIDITLSVFLIIALTPLFIVLPFLIILGSGWPFLFKRKVCGKYGRQFNAYKFRTMVNNAEKLLLEDQILSNEYIEKYKIVRDPRITKIGSILRKYSLDELPQLFNVLQGQMSLVGPRMMTSQEIELYGNQKDLLLSVRPGLTGLWQISGRQELSFDRRIELDLVYIKNYTLWQDIRIIFRTPIVVLKAIGAY